MKSSLLGSTSDSNINKYSTINKIPLITLNFTEGNDKKAHSPPTSEKAIIAPKVKDRTHNVTEKVTQVSLKILFIFFGAGSAPPYRSIKLKHTPQEGLKEKNAPTLFFSALVWELGAPCF